MEGTAWRNSKKAKSGITPEMAYKDIPLEFHLARCPLSPSRLTLHTGDSSTPPVAAAQGTAHCRHIRWSSPSIWSHCLDLDTMLLAKAVFLSLEAECTVC